MFSAWAIRTQVVIACIIAEWTEGGKKRAQRPR
jgi:hypothetical protein